jgi:diamine N-acetyltransferase
MDIIKLRKVSKKDEKLFLKWWSDDEIIRLTSGIRGTSRKVLKKYFDTLLTSKKDRHFLILLRRKVIGHIALTHKSRNIFEIHIIIGEKQYWGKGYGVLAIMKAIDYAFNKMNYQRAYLEVRPDNKRAIVAYKKCGFVKIGYKIYSNNKYQPKVLKMALRKEEFDIKFNCNAKKFNSRI